MKFQIVGEVPYPRELVFRTQRDRLHTMVDRMPNVSSIVTESRVEEGDIVSLVNIWTGSADDIPGVIRPLLKKEYLTWVDKARWDAGKWRCDWEITLGILSDAITAKGYNLFEDEGDETVIRMFGEFEVHPDKVPGVPTLVARGAKGTLERFVVGLVEPNLKRTNQVVGEYIEAHHDELVG